MEGYATTQALEGVYQWPMFQLGDKGSKKKMSTEIIYHEFKFIMLGPISQESENLHLSMF